MSKFLPNPYIVGDAIKDPERFFGREDLFHDINDFLQDNVQLILLYGQRRVGKSSVLKQIPKKINKDEFVFINFDFQNIKKSHLPDILYEIARDIKEDIQTETLTHLAENIKTNIEIFSRNFLPEVYQQIGNKKLVLLWDEFDVLSKKDTESDTDISEFCNYIIQLLKRDEKLFIIPVVGGNISALPKFSYLFKEAPQKKIDLLDENDIKKLIIKPAEKVLKYESGAVDEILNLSARHPYFTQVICFELFGSARERKQYNISCQDVSNIVKKIFDSDHARGGLAWFWDGLTPKQQVIFAAAAEAQDIAIQENKALQNPQMLLKNYGIDSANYLTEAHAELDKYGFLDYTGCKVKIELVRLWLVETHRLKDEISTLEKVDEEAVNTLLSAADGLRQRNDPLALQIYEKALKINPNNFTTVMSLAKEYLNSGQLNEVGDLCKRAYQFYSINNKQESVDEEDVKNLLSAADELRERNDPLALQIYEKALKINPNNFTTVMSLAEEYSKSGQLNQAYEFYKRAYQLLEEIKVPKSKTNLNVEDTNTNYVPAHKPSPTIPKWLNRSSILRASLGLAGIVVIGAGISQVFRTCPTGERKELGVFCVVDNSRISRGDRTFSPETTNIPRDKGIQALKKGDYPQAANLFKQAIKAKQNDPEVLIYYNNALARQQGSPFTLAVVVPLDKDQDDRNDAQEILRGVAQAQNQFNSNKGLNGRLLEIVIANDSNTEKAKEVAQSLIKDSSILGVIGHNSSDDTKAALPEYAKAKLAVISPTSTSILLNNPVFFRAVYSDESAGKTLAEYTYKSLKLKKAVVFGNPNSPYSNSIREVFTNQFEKLGSEVVHKPLIDLTAPTFDAEKEVAKSVYSNKAEAALLFPDTRSTKIALKIAIETTKRNETLKTKNPPRPELKMLAGDTLYNNETLTSGGKNVEGLIIAIPWFRETPQAQSFAKKAEQQWGGGISWRTATSFDATQALIKALSNNPSRSTVLGRLENVSLSANETSGDPLKFTPEREREGQSILLQIKGGKFMPIDSVKP